MARYEEEETPWTRQLLVGIQEPDGAPPGDLVALDPATGQQTWRRALPGGVDHVDAVGGVLLGRVEGRDGHVQQVVRLG